MHTRLKVLKIAYIYITAIANSCMCILLLVLANTCIKYCNTSLMQSAHYCPDIGSVCNTIYRQRKVHAGRIKRKFGPKPRLYLEFSTYQGLDN